MFNEASNRKINTHE